MITRRASARGRTREEIMETPAGVCLNAIVAEDVMGVAPRPGIGYFDLPPYSTDWTAAHMVLRRVESLLGTNQIELRRYRAFGWQCVIFCDTGYSATAVEAPEAICKASALAVLGYKDKQFR